MPEFDPRRVRRMAVSQEEVLTAVMGLRKAQFVRVIRYGEALPADVKVLSVHDNPVRRGFWFLLHSQEFDPVPEGQPVPEVPRPEWVYLKVRVDEDPCDDCDTLVVESPRN